MKIRSQNIPTAWDFYWFSRPFSWTFFLEAIKLWFYENEWLHSARHGNSVIHINSTKLIRRIQPRTVLTFSSEFKLSFVCEIRSGQRCRIRDLHLFSASSMTQSQWLLMRSNPLCEIESNIQHSSFQLSALEWFAKYFKFHALNFIFRCCNFFNCFLKRRHTIRAISLATGC